MNGVSLRIMKCPTCGAKLKAANPTDVIVCVYCGNSIVPVPAAAAVENREETASAQVMQRIEGIQTPSSALAYMEQFFEEYDWETFAYERGLSVPEIDRLAKSMKVSSADDKNTWLVCFRAVWTPYLKKMEGCRKILELAVKEYREDSLEAYSKFDAYKRIAGWLLSGKAEVAAELERIAGKAVKYGATAEEAAAMRKEIDTLQGKSLPEYDTVEKIPEIVAFNEEKNAKIVASLAAKGIHAEGTYVRAKELIAAKQYVEALNLLLMLEGYADSSLLARKVDKYYLIDDVLEIEGVRYFYQKESPEAEYFNLYPTVGLEVGDRPLIRKIGKIITNYADLLYYLDSNGRLKRFSFTTLREEQLYPKYFWRDFVYVYNRRVYLLSQKDGQGDELVELRLATGEAQPLLYGVQSVLYEAAGKLTYTAYEPTSGAEPGLFSYVIDVETRAITKVGSPMIKVEGYVKNHIVFTQPAPNEYNRSLCIRALKPESKTYLLEKNILSFCSIVSDKLFFYIGSASNKTLISMSYTGSGRREFPLYVNDVLFEQGGWLYSIRRVLFNSVLCKSRMDGSEFSIIAGDITTYIGIKNGYLYYLDDQSSLIKVRMDGSNLQVLCKEVETVLSTQEDRIVFLSVDGRIGDGSGGMRVVKSIYAVEFSGKGKLKLAYDVDNAMRYDDNTVYYTATEYLATNAYDGVGRRSALYRLDLNSAHTERLLNLRKEPAPSGGSGFAIAMIVFVIALIFALVGISGEAAALAVISVVVAVVSLLIGVSIKGNSM